MPQDRQKSPGSFQDELDGVIRRVAPAEPKPPDKQGTKEKQAGEKAELDNRLFESAWRNGD